jgi:hypothetical protein
MLKCALCGQRLEPTAAWKGRGERYYCNGFCAEAEQADWPAPALSDEAPPTPPACLSASAQEMSAAEAAQM